MKKIIFVANSSKRFKYYRLLANKMQAHAEVIFPLLPSRAFFSGIFKSPPVNEVLLLESHLIRQKINYPLLSKTPFIWKLYCLLAKTTERARFNHYYHIFMKLECETVAIWNGQKQPYLTMVEAAKYAQKKVLFFENGLLPNTTTIDYKGVNGYNCLPRCPSFYLNFKSNFDSTNISKDLIVRAPHKKRNTLNQKEISLPENYIFIPFQVPADSQIVIHSPWIKSMEQMFLTILKIKQELVAKNNSELPYFIFKEHPSWPGNFEELYHLDSNLIFANQNNTQELIEKSQAVITINSTVGLESLLLGKKVITLGNACYNVKQLVQHVKNEQELKAAIRGLASWNFNNTLRKKFLEYIASYYCIPISWDSLLIKENDAHLQAAVNRIYETDDLSEHLKYFKPVYKEE